MAFLFKPKPVRLSAITHEISNLARFQNHSIVKDLREIVPHDPKLIKNSKYKYAKKRLLVKMWS